MNTGKTVLITGSTGFLGSHVLEHFLDAGYHVIAICRMSKAVELRKRSHQPEFRVAIVENLANDDFSSVLQGVHAVVHVASPTPFYSNHVEVAVKGSINLFNQAYAAGVRKFIFISSIYSVFTDFNHLLDSSRRFDHNSWGTAPEYFRIQSKKCLGDLQALSKRKENENTYARFYDMGKRLLHSFLWYFNRPKSHTNSDNDDNLEKQSTPPTMNTDPFTTYAVSKLLAEEAVWSFADAHPDADVISILPSYFYGPISKYHIIREPTTLSTNYILYSLFAVPQAAYPPESIPDHVVDVRDVAKACVLAMTAAKPQSTHPRHRRILLCSGTFSWKEVAVVIAQTYPHIQNRVVDRGEPMELSKRGSAQIDVSMAGDILGWREYIPWQTTIKDAVASLLETENQWNGSVIKP